MSHNTVLHRAVHPLVKAMARAGIAPDPVTGLRLLTGLCAAACLLAGRGPWMALGGAVLLFSMLLDRADGALARATGRHSRHGARFDLVSDCVCTMALFLGLGIGVGALPGGIATSTGALLGSAAAVSVGAIFLMLNQRPGGETRSRPLDPDDAMLVVPPLIWCGQGGTLLWLAAILSPAAALGVILAALLRRRRRPAAGATLRTAR